MLSVERTDPSCDRMSDSNSTASACIGLDCTHANTSIITGIEGDHLDLVSAVELVNRGSIGRTLEGDDQIGRVLGVLRDELESKTSVGSGY